MKSLKLPDTTVTMAEQVSSGTVKIPGIKMPMRELPVFCRVAGVIRPAADSEIGFEVWMPENDWNGRFLGVGNGGFAGSIGYQGLAGNLRRSFATAGSDAGHKGEAEDASWAFGHPEKIKDFGWRGVHLTTARTKDIVEAYYGRATRKIVFRFMFGWRTRGVDGSRAFSRGLRWNTGGRAGECMDQDAERRRRYSPGDHTRPAGIHFELETACHRTGGAGAM